MDNYIEDFGKNNQILIDQTVIRTGSLRVRVMGDNNKLVIGSGTRLGNGLIEFTHDDSEIIIGEGCLINGQFR